MKFPFIVGKDKNEKNSKEVSENIDDTHNNEQEKEVEPKKKKKKLTKEEKEAKKAQKKLGKKAQKSDAVLLEGEAPQKKKTPSKLIIIIGVVVALIIVALIIFFVFIKKDKGNTNEVNPTPSVTTPVTSVNEDEPPIDAKHTDIVYNTEVWYADENWSHLDEATYKLSNIVCDDEEKQNCYYEVTDSVVGSKIHFLLTAGSIVESCNDFFCEDKKPNYKLTGIQMEYPGGVRGGQYSVGDVNVETMEVWSLLGDVIYTDIRNNATSFKSICKTARSEAIKIVEHESSREGTNYNEVGVYVRACRYAGKYN